MFSVTAERTAMAVVGGLVLVVLVAAVIGGVYLTAQEPAAAALTAGSRSTFAEPALRRSERNGLGPALAASGVAIPPGANVYAAIVREGRGGLVFEEYEAGGGSSADNFWPASSLKPMVAVGALEFLNDLGFTGLATVTFAGNRTWTVRELYRAAITESDNEAYDRLVEVAGIDWLNTKFLNEENGFPETVVQKSYVTIGPVPSSTVTVREGSRVLTLPPRPATGDYGVARAGNRSTLYEMTDAVSRVLLDQVLPTERRYEIHPVDVLGIRQALLAVEGFVDPGVAATLGRGAFVYDKPGYVQGDDCVDVAYIETPDREQAFLLGVSIPDDGRVCATLATIAQETLEFLSANA